MPFSVSTTEFVPYDGATRRVDAAAATCAVAAPTPSDVESGGKSRVCVAFYEAAQCPYSNRCEHAHHFSELNSNTQNKLLETVPVESIPRHFMAPHRNNNADHAVFHKGHNMSATRAATCGEKTKTAGHRRSGKRSTRLHDLSGSNACDISLSSLASSTDSFIPRSAQSSKDASPQKGMRRDDIAEPFRIRLPARCRYPHRNTPGTYYDILGVPRSATQEEILASYRRWQREYKRVKQVDQQRADAHDNVVVEARNVVGHPVLRAEYDRTLPSFWGGVSATLYDTTATATATNNNLSGVKNNINNNGIHSSSNNTNRDAMRGNTTAASSANSSRSVNVDNSNVYVASMRMVKSNSSVDMLSLNAAGLADDGIW
ncbi:protein G2 [Trypanosoma grayi]|uniref:protein G2 n=1 Tax=Trypanosoma grayi TaxID=71804 RepID=UPI0004F45F72|nr:protein G2 [Trypanosoma grayi]KEG11992.1 protein G2 [Trypanosoma grayi]